MPTVDEGRTKDEAAVAFTLAAVLTRRDGRQWKPVVRPDRPATPESGSSNRDGTQVPPREAAK
jgi:hypothetical protein